MKLSAPKKSVFWISVVAFVIGMLGVVGALPFIPQFVSFFIVLIGYVLLLLGNILKGL
jgi:hypothetical protein